MAAQLRGAFEQLTRRGDLMVPACGLQALGVSLTLSLRFHRKMLHLPLKSHWFDKKSSQ